MAESVNQEQCDGRQMLRTAEELIAQASDLVGGRLIFIECKVADPEAADGMGGDLRSYYGDAGYEEYAVEGGYCTLGKRILE